PKTRSPFLFIFFAIGAATTAEHRAAAFNSPSLACSSPPQEQITPAMASLQLPPQQQITPVRAHPRPPLASSNRASRPSRLPP
uniref:Uncharacterized protein n=1 Tax=Triticum urartu TaxID=4572 RepID=A0A8R7QB20_TRIUA